MTLHLATTTAIAGLPDLSAAPARRLASEAEAIAAAHEVAAAIAPITRDHDREGEIPGEQLRLLSESGVTAIAVPKELGGLGASIETIVETVRIISTADGGVGQILQLHNVMIGGILASPDAAYRAFFAPRILAGERFGNALAEVGGKNKLDLRTILSPHDDGSYRLNGRKFYATGSYLAHWLSVGVATPEGGGRGNVIIPRDAPGLTVIDDWRAFGQRNTMSGTVIFEDVHVPAFFSPRGRKPARTALTRAQILHAAIDTGIARGALTAAVDYLRNASRAWIESGEERIVDEPHVIKQVGEFENAVYAAELLLREAARAFDRQLADPDSEALQTLAILAVAHARVQADKASLFVGAHIFDLMGASAVQEKFNLDRFWRNARAHTTHDPIRWRLHAIGDHRLNDAAPIDFPLSPEGRKTFLGE
ncbi:acyl-CoA dehydrogenase family protein [Sphingomonas sp.]|uniref:acyl-CoA dehydrogenase family protein n=2 Tax=unclassified Sphingomonas TaxID=196159 RepID=UPI002579DA0D|nr:acyl-CoA dehydrogenase family protein [Sphingomonas sp.]